MYLHKKRKEKELHQNGENVCTKKNDFFFFREETKKLKRERIKWPIFLTITLKFFFCLTLSSSSEMFSFGFYCGADGGLLPVLFFSLFLTNVNLRICANTVYILYGLYVGRASKQNK